MTIEEQEIKMDGIIAIFKKQWKLMLLPSFIATILVVFSSKFMPKTYESYALLRIGYEGGRQLESIASLQEIMKSRPLVEKIVSQLPVQERPERIPAFLDFVKYDDTAGLLQIKASADTPEKAFRIAQAATNIVSERHQELFVQAQQKMRALISVVKEILQPVPLSSGISDLRIEPTTIAVAPVIDQEPIPSGTRKKALTTFFSVFVICTFIAFYQEGRKESDS